MCATKICIKCKIEKSIEEFNIRADTKTYTSFCKNCLKKYSHEYNIIYQARKKEEIKQQQKIYKQKNKENILKKQKEYYTKNKEKILQRNKEYRDKNKEKIIENKRRYNKTENGIFSKKNSSHKRRTIKKDGDVTTEQLLKLQQNAKKCYWCGCILKNVKVHLDHYEPLSKGGEHTINNLVVSCSKCNNLKYSKDPLKFANSIGRLL